MSKTRGERIVETLRDPDEGLKVFSHIAILLVLHFLKEASFEKIQKELFERVYKDLKQKNNSFCFVYGSGAHDPSGKSPGLDAAIGKYFDLKLIECFGDKNKPEMHRLSLKGKVALLNSLPFIRDFVNEVCVKASDYCELHCSPPDYGSEFIFQFLKS